jgi:hypothetical protein
MPSHAKLVEPFPMEMGKRKDITKQLGIPFGLRLEVNDINAFLLNKVKKKLSFWCSTHLSLVGRTLIVNQILLSTLWYFICVCVCVWGAGGGSEYF